MEEIKIYVVGNSTHYASWIDNHKLVDNIEDADIVLFTGGEDVDPKYYNEENPYQKEMKSSDAVNKYRGMNVDIAC